MLDAQAARFANVLEPWRTQLPMHNDFIYFGCSPWWDEFKPCESADMSNQAPITQDDQRAESYQTWHTRIRSVW